jgi:M6 family metalloprotease-like protein
MVKSYKKIIFVLFVLFPFSFSAIHAAYLKNVPQQVTQPDGSIIHCFASGDEFHNWLHDSAGYTIIQDSKTGYYVYAIQAGDTVLPSQHIVGRVAPMAVGLKPNINISAQTWIAKRANIEKIQNQTPVHKALKKNEGLINNIAFFIAFADDTGYTKTYNFMSEMYNDSSSWDANSLYNYYRTVSYKKMYIITHFFPAPADSTVRYYKDIHPRDYFRPASATNPIGYSPEEEYERERDLLLRTINYFRDSIPPSMNLDFNSDGNIDNICFIVTGAPGAWSSLLWPHRYHLSDTTYINGKRVYDYNFQIEESSYPGVITHEMMHTLSALDLYRYNNTSVDPVGSWDLMASTNYPSPQGLSAYMKYTYGGWIDSMPEITSPGTYTLYPANGTSPEKTIYLLRPNSFSTDDYLALEYRNTSSNIFEANLPGSGLLIYRINFGFEGQGNASYDGNKIFDEIYLYRPNGSAFVNGSLYQAHFAKNYNRTTFGPLSNPHPFDRYDNGIGNILITDITEAGDSIQFTIRPQIDTLETDVEEVVLDCGEGAKSQFSINSNTLWTITNINSWLLINNNSGKGNGNITVQTLSANTLSTARTANLRIDLSLSGEVKRLNLRQLPCNSIETINHNAVISLFPNPAENRLTIVYPQTNEPTDISIYSITGQLIPFTIVESKDNATTIDIGKFSSGVYYMKLQSAKQSTVKSFVVK